MPWLACCQKIKIKTACIYDCINKYKEKKNVDLCQDVQGVIHKIQSTRFLLWVKFKLMRNTNHVSGQARVTSMHNTAQPWTLWLSLLICSLAAKKAYSMTQVPAYAYLCSKPPMLYKSLQLQTLPTEQHKKHNDTVAHQSWNKLAEEIRLQFVVQFIDHTVVFVVTV